MLKSTSFTFGTLLAMYLAGIGFGAAAGSAVAGRVRRPGLGFFALQAGAGAYAALSFTAFIALLGHSRWPAWFVAYFGGYDAIDVRAVVAAAPERPGHRGSGCSRMPTSGCGTSSGLYGLLPAALIGPPTFMAGFAFPLLQRAVHTDLAQVGRRVGTLLAANILGSTLGAFVTGWFLLDALGTGGTLKLVFLLSAGFGALAVRELTSQKRAGVRAAAYAGTALVVAGVVRGDARRAAPLGASARHDAVERDRRRGWLRAVGAQGGTRRLRPRRRVRQRPRPELDSVWQRAHHPRGASGVYPPESAQRRGRLASDPATRCLPWPDAASWNASRRSKSSPLSSSPCASCHGPSAIQVSSAFSTTRASSTSPATGVSYLRRAGRKYDIVEADALRPTSAYSGNLYSDAYFRLLRDHLNPGGLAVTWAPTARVVRTFRTVFPYVWHGQEIMMGSDAPIDMNRAAILARSAAAGGGQLLWLVRSGYRDDARPVSRWPGARRRKNARAAGPGRHQYRPPSAGRVRHPAADSPASFEMGGLVETPE